MKKTAFLIFTSFLFVFVFAFSSQAQTDAPPEVVKFLTRQAKAVDAEEYPEARKIVFADMNGDRKNDLVVLYTLEGFGGGNSYGQSIAVFLRKGNRYVLSVDKTVGGKLSRNVELKRISGRTIYLDTMRWSKDDGGCCPSIKGKTRFVFSNGRLREV
ncbi:MAG: hypothetical protein HOP17_13375 [Acidobacteria bacterium]|nr:hypothetical protein [Acidobacteriota bacterium]